MVLLLGMDSKFIERSSNSSSKDPPVPLDEMSVISDLLRLKLGLGRIEVLLFEVPFSDPVAVIVEDDDVDFCLVKDNFVNDPDPVTDLAPISGIEVEDGNGTGKGNGNDCTGTGIGNGN